VLSLLYFILHGVSAELFESDCDAVVSCRCRSWLLRSQQSCVYLLQRDHCAGSVLLVHVAKGKSAMGVV